MWAISDTAPATLLSEGLFICITLVIIEISLDTMYSYIALYRGASAYAVFCSFVSTCTIAPDPRGTRTRRSDLAAHAELILFAVA